MCYLSSVIVYIVCMYVLIKRRHKRNTSATWILIGTSTIQFLLATVHVAVALRVLIEGFIHTEDVPKGAFNYWINPATTAQVIAKAVYITNILVAGCVLIWRMYLVWGRNIYVCILPIVMTLCSMVTGYIGLSKLAQITGDLQPDSIFNILDWLIPTWSLFIATELLSTVLIAGKIWWHAKRDPVAKSFYLSLISVVVESGAILTLSTTFLLAFMDRETQTGAILADMATQIATIAPTLIIIRVELLRSTKRQLFINQTTGYDPDQQQSEPPVQILVTTLSVSELNTNESEKQVKSPV
ncbi:hypothetical protein D9619_008339 [Psilocybe cf. subviscida]|uniref:Uncharacterized protein n=1 Tax=Psilocybe cf. subviscida TaxID=2480587 RepID=A0A8H5BB04_9AGAR|nr:hypothetical protein D9619_008339 [Psilocybe cf. subviscida]